MPELHTAAYLGDLVTLKRRLAVDDPNARAMNGTTALMSAYYKKQEEAYSLLIQHGADPNLVDKEGHDVLSLVMTRGNSYEWVLFVLKRGSIPDPVRHKGLLAWAVRHCPLTVLDTIVRASPHMVDDVDQDGRTPLHLILQRGFLMPIKNITVTLLLQKGANVGAKDKWGMTPRDVLSTVSRNISHESPLWRPYQGIDQKLVDAENAVWLYSVARVLQAKDREGEFEAWCVPVFSTGIPQDVLHHVVCRLNPSLVQELAIML